MRIKNKPITHNNHTATILTLFTFGPSSNNFTGTYDNTESYKKNLKSFITTK